MQAERGCRSARAALAECAAQNARLVAAFAEKKREVRSLTVELRRQSNAENAAVASDAVQAVETDKLQEGVKGASLDTEGGLQGSEGLADALLTAQQELERVRKKYEASCAREKERVKEVAALRKDVADLKEQHQRSSSFGGGRTSSDSASSEEAGSTWQRAVAAEKEARAWEREKERWAAERTRWAEEKARWMEELQNTRKQRKVCTLSHLVRCLR